jgi:[protein-PII] uridylyltransferase
LAAPGSDLKDAPPASTDLKRLGALPDLRPALAAALSGLEASTTRRSAAVSVIAAARDQARREIEDFLTVWPLHAEPVVAALTKLSDEIVSLVRDIALSDLAPGLATADDFAIIAVGGYGRAEMAPESDVDLLFLIGPGKEAQVEPVVMAMLYVLWDLKLKVGHATRTVKDCLKYGREDYTIRTALLEHRFVTGNQTLASELATRLRKEVFKGTARDFIEAKLKERTERHQKQGGQRYVVEPNVKEGKGGLRDLQSLYWIDKYLHDVDDTAELVKRGVFTESEYATFRAAEDFLTAVRCHLHFITRRPMDQLTFDLQVEVAARMSYRDKDGRRAVEHFMQDYFRHATAVGELTRIFLTDLEDRHVKSEPMLTRLFGRKKAVREPFKVENNRLTVVSAKKFLADKLNFLLIFEEVVRTGYHMHPDAMRLLAANLDQIDEDLRASEQANHIFLDLLLKHGNPERALRHMNELGVLAAFLPEFEPIVAMMQFNMYHHFTVDEHIIQCISNLAQIERRELIEELPVASRILEEGVNRKVLYAALLLHDIGKGRDEDHSILGARIARQVAPRLGLKEDEAETVEWLVRFHLLMSDTAQKRDLADPRTVRDFAKAVKTKKRLDLLCVLTVCDIRGVGPGTWNNWKAMLLRALYKETAAALEGGLEDVNRENRTDEAKRSLREVLNDWDARDLRTETQRHYDPYWQGLPPSAHLVLAHLLRDIPDDEIRVDLFLDKDRDATRASFALTDHPGIFSRLAGALALVGANVVDARTYTTKDGYATAVFWVQDADGHPYDVSRHDRLKAMITRILKGEVVARDALKDRDKIKKREREFRVPTSITFDNLGSEIYTIIEVDTRDRPGLLYDLTRTLASNNVYIASAVIATFGLQVVDTFYVKDAFGLKFHAEHRQKALEKKLREAIERGAEQAVSG